MKKILLPIAFGIIGIAVIACLLVIITSLIPLMSNPRFWYAIVPLVMVVWASFYILATSCD